MGNRAEGDGMSTIPPDLEGGEITGGPMRRPSSSGPILPPQFSRNPIATSLKLRGSLWRLRVSQDPPKNPRGGLWGPHRLASPPPPPAPNPNRSDGPLLFGISLALLHVPDFLTNN